MSADAFNAALGTRRGTGFADADREAVLRQAYARGAEVRVDPGDRYIAVLRWKDESPRLLFQSDEDYDAVIWALEHNLGNGFKALAVLDLDGPADRPFIPARERPREGARPEVVFDPDAPRSQRMTFAEVFGD